MAIQTKRPPCGVGVGGGHYPGYIPLSLSDFRRPTVHNPLLQLHQRCQGFPLIGGPVKCTVGLFLAEGMLLLGGQLVSEVGFVNGTNIVADRYPAQNYSTGVPWAAVPPTSSELANATVDATHSPAGHPCLFILAPPGNSTAPATAPPIVVAPRANTKY
jgi:hypothetical protein